MKKAIWIAVFLFAALGGALVVARFLGWEPAIEPTERQTPVTPPLPAASDESPVAADQRPSVKPEAGRTPAGPPESRRRPPSPAPREKKSSDEIRGEHLVAFYDNRDRDAFLKLARARGAQVLDLMDFAHAARIRVKDEADWKALLDSGPAPVEQGVNYSVRSPERPGAKMEIPQGQCVGFGDHSLFFLGVPPNNFSWGKGATVAVLDTGVRPHTALLEENITRIDLIQEKETEPDDHAWHGTAVASLIAGNSPDLRGIAPAARILSIKVMSNDGTGDAFTVARGIVEAVDSGAKVINICMGTSGDCFILRKAVAYAQENGAAVVASVGNDGAEGVSFPAAYEGVVAVSSVDAAGQHMFFANRGPQVDIAAPGIGVISAWKDNQPAVFSGTSAAAPFVSGALAWLMSANPGMSAADAVQLLYRYANDTDLPGKDEDVGYGILSVRRLQERDVKGIFDIAVGNPVVRPVKPGDREVVVTVCAQNRGTVPLPLVDLAFAIDNRPRTASFSDVAVGQTVSQNFPVDVERLRTGPLAVTVTATIRGAEDAYPGDNSRTFNLAPLQTK